MNSLKEIRIAAGMSQQEFSSLLGVQRELLGMAESGLRTLTSEAIVNLWQIEKYLMENEAKTELTYSGEDYEKEKARLERVKETLENKRATLEEKLSKMCERFASGQNTYRLCMYLKNNNLLDAAIIENMIVSARSKIFANGEIPQAEVKAQILLLSAEASSIIQRLEHLSQIQTL